MNIEQEIEDLKKKIAELEDTIRQLIKKVYHS